MVHQVEHGNGRIVSQITQKVVGKIAPYVRVKVKQAFFFKLERAYPHECFGNGTPLKKIGIGPYALLCVEVCIPVAFRKNGGAVFGDDNACSRNAFPDIGCSYAVDDAFVYVLYRLYVLRVLCCGGVQ